MKVGFYLAGEKGYETLVGFIDKFRVEQISFVCAASDENLVRDFYLDIKGICENNHIPFYDRKDDFIVMSDYQFAIGWRWMLSVDNLIVLHDSILPKYRGFSPLVNMLIDGRSEIGVTALKASKEYDRGELISQSIISIGYPIKIKDAIKLVSHLYVKLVLGMSEKILSGEGLVAFEQIDVDASYSLWRDEKDYIINWHHDSSRIVRFIDAVGEPYSGAQSKIKGMVVKINDSTLYPDVTVEDRCSHIGKIIFIDDGFPVVVCGKGLLKITSISDEHGNSLLGKIPFRTRFE